MSNMDWNDNAWDDNGVEEGTAAKSNISKEKNTKNAKNSKISKKIASPTAAKASSSSSSSSTFKDNNKITKIETDQAEEEEADWNAGSAEADTVDAGDADWDAPDNSKDESWENDTKEKLEEPELKRQSSFGILDEDTLEQRRKELIKATSELLFVDDDEAGCLLRHYGWKNGKLQTEWFTDQIKVRSATGVTGKAKSAPPPKTDKIQCQSAFCDEVAIAQAFALDCGHWFCADCWKGYLTSQVTHGRTCVFTRCMGFRCKKNHRHGFGCACDEMVPESVFKKYVGDADLLTKYKRWVLDSFVEGQKNIKWCPRPQCGRAVEYNVGGVRDIGCKCGYHFCVSCLEEAHTPAPCDLVKKWKEKESSDDATTIWLAARTKERPQCQVRIEKNRACNHMKCAKCGHDFCWLCKGPWAQHGSATGGYYVCNKYNEENTKGNLSSEEKKMYENQQILQKYTYYYKHFKSSEDAIKFTMSTWKKIEAKLGDQEYNKVAFLQDAVSKLTEARRVLQWTYSMAYYLKSGREKELFEFQQNLLLEKTEHLQDIMDSNQSSTEKLMENKRKIIDLTSSIDKFRKDMVERVESGEFEALLLSHADLSANMWACTVCKTENKNDAEFCAHSSCGACRKHGEPECKACKKH